MAALTSTVRASFVGGALGFVGGALGFVGGALGFVAGALGFVGGAGLRLFPPTLLGALRMFGSLVQCPH